jgi:hypothetical protein
LRVESEDRKDRSKVETVVVFEVVGIILGRGRKKIVFAGMRLLLRQMIKSETSS